MRTFAVSVITYGEQQISRTAHRCCWLAKSRPPVAICDVTFSPTTLPVVNKPPSYLSLLDKSVWSQRLSASTGCFQSFRSILNFKYSKLIPYRDASIFKQPKSRKILCGLASLKINRYRDQSQKLFLGWSSAASPGGPEKAFFRTSVLANLESYQEVRQLCPSVLEAVGSWVNWLGIFRRPWGKDLSLHLCINQLLSNGAMKHICVWNKMLHIYLRTHWPVDFWLHKITKKSVVGQNIWLMHLQPRVLHNLLLG